LEACGWVCGTPSFFFCGHAAKIVSTWSHGLHVVGVSRVTIGTHSVPPDAEIPRSQATGASDKRASLVGTMSDSSTRFLIKDLQRNETQNVAE